MSKRSIPPQGSKDAYGAYIKQKPLPPKSIDELLASGLTNIERIMDGISMRSAAGVAEREDVQSLKDLITLLHDLKDKEREIMEELTDEELEERAN